MAAELLLEREAELGALSELFARAAGGHGGLVLVEGPPGVGKTALLERAAELARSRGLGVLRARGHELERAFGWGVARSLLEASPAIGSDRERAELMAGPAAPAGVLFEHAEHAAGAPASEAGFAILQGLRWLVVRLARRAPLLLIVDDAQWADEPSLRFLVYLTGRLSDQPIAVLVGARLDERGEGGLLEQLAGDSAAQVRVPAPLSAAAVTRLVRERLAGADDGFCRRCLELTAGNPLQLRALLAAIEQQGRAADGVALVAAAELAARSLGRSVLRRLGALSPDARALARAVAVLEDDAPLGLAGTLATLTSAATLSAADELARADVLRAGDPVGFTHPLVRAAVYGRLGFGERAQLHRRAAGLLAASGAPGERVSAHLLESATAGDDVVVGVLRAAARRALAQGVPGSAVRYLERALREPPAEADRAGVLEELGRAEAAAGRPAAASHLEAATELVAAPRTRAALLLELGRVLHDGGRLIDASATFRRGLDELGAAAVADERHAGAGDTRRVRQARDADELAVDLESGYLTSAMLEPELAADAHRRVDAILASEALLSSRAGRALVSKAMIMRLFAGGPHDEILAVAHRLLGDGRLIEEDGADSQARSHVIGCLSWCDDFEAAEHALRLSFADAQRRGSVLTFAMAAQLRARQRLWTGPIAVAVADARAADEIWRTGLHMYVHASGHALVSGLLELGEPDEADRVLAPAGEQPAASGFFAAWRQSALGRVAAYRGDDAAALEAFLAVGRRLAELLAVNPTVLPWRSEAGLAAQRLGRRDRAHELIAEELALAERFGAPRAIGVARRADGLLERGEAAVERLRAAVEPLAACGARIEQTRALIDLGSAIRRAGRPTEARDTLREALVLAEATGARALAERARDELRIAGGRVPARRASARRTHPQRASRGRARGRRPEQPADRRRAVRHGEVGRVAPGQRLPQARHPRPRPARRDAGPGRRPRRLRRRRGSRGRCRGSPQ